jgi:hypothetical protein
MSVLLLPSRLGASDGPTVGLQSGQVVGQPTLGHRYHPVSPRGIAAGCSAPGTIDAISPASTGREGR